MGRATRSDAELIAACRGGDCAAFGEIVERYQRAVGAVSFSGTGDRALADDVTQDTFVTAWRQLKALRDVERLPAWLCGIARNLARTARLKRGRETDLDDHHAAGEGSPFEQLSDREDEHAVATSLAKVPETYREALVLFYCEQQSVKAVAQALGITENATHQRLARGRQHLADGVGQLERTLERRRPRAGLAAAVVAAITAVGSSQVEANTTRNRTEGSTMFKFGIATVLLTAIAGTGYVVARSEDAPTTSTTNAAEDSTTLSAPTSAGATTSNARPTAMNSGASGAAPQPTPRSSDGDTYSCTNVTRHLTMMMALTQADLTEMLEQGEVEAVERHMQPQTDNYLEDCTKLSWSLEIRKCIASVNDFIELQSKCKPPPVQARGTEQIVIEDETHPPYTGSDESCASVGRRMMELGRPSEATYAKLQPDTREAMERMLATVPETVETNCETAPWSLAVRRCIFAATTRNAAFECTKKK